MARSSRPRRNGNSNVSTPETETQSIADQIKLAFYEHHKRQILGVLTNVDIERLTADHTDTEGNVKNVEALFSAIIDLEQSKAKEVMAEDAGVSTSRIEHTREMLDILNSDTELQELITTATAAADLPPRAPAHIAFRLVQDFSTKFKLDATAARRKIIETFADPGSKQKEGKDGRGNELGDNEKKGYFWDWADRGAGNLSWFAVDCYDQTRAGISINKTREALREKKDEIILLDGVSVNPSKLANVNLKNALQQHDARRNRGVQAYRTAIAVIRLWQEIQDRLGRKVDEQGNVTDVGRVLVDWAWLDAADKSAGLSPTKALILIHNVIQDGEEKGQRGGASESFTANTFIQLSVDKAITNAATNGRTLDKVTYLDVINAKVTKTPTTSGDKTPNDSDNKTILIAANALPKFFEGVRLQTENDGFTKAFQELQENMAKDVFRALCYDMVETMNWLDNNITPTMTKVHDEILAEKLAAEEKEREEKQKKLAS